MTKGGHLWAIGFDTMTRAQEVRGEIARLGERRCLILLDISVAVHYPDGSVTLDGEPLAAPLNFWGKTVAGFLAGLALAAPPLTGAAVGAVVSGSAAEAGLDDGFVREVAALMKPGTSTLFVLDREGDMEPILQGIRGLGGTVVKTNVDVERARLIQATLSGAAPDRR